MEPKRCFLRTPDQCVPRTVHGNIGDCAPCPRNRFRAVYHRNSRWNENRRGFELIKLSGEGGLKPTCKNLNGVSSFAGEPGRPASKDAAMASDRNSRTNNSLPMMRQQHSEAYSLGRSARQTGVDSEMLKKSALPSENPAHYHLLGRVRLRIIGISHQRQSHQHQCCLSIGSSPHHVRTHSHDVDPPESPGFRIPFSLMLEKRCAVRSPFLTLRFYLKQELYSMFAYSLMYRTSEKIMSSLLCYDTFTNKEIFIKKNIE